MLAAAALAGGGLALTAYYHAPAQDAPPRPQAQAAIRVPLFVDPAQVRPTPRFRFTFDAPETLEELRRVEGLDSVVAGATSDMERARRLMRWTRRQWDPGIPSPYPPLDARIILRDIRRGFTGGFCAQYNYVLAQALQSIGIAARYVSLVEHEVIEARLRDRAAWVCLDPQNDVWHADPEGRPLSVYEIHARARAGAPVVLSEGHRVQDPVAHLAAFAIFAVWIKNDHVGAPINFTDIERYKVYFLDDPSDARNVPAPALVTSEPADLYPG